MEKSIQSAMGQTRNATLVVQLQKSNEVSEQYGLTLSQAQIHSLIIAEAQSQRACGRLEFGEGILPRLIYAFCDSPYLFRDTYCDSLEALQNLFYLYKNDLYDALSDDELVEAMQKLFHGKAQGSLEYLENITAEDLMRVLRSDDTHDEDDDV